MLQNKDKSEKNSIVFFVSIIVVIIIVVIGIVISLTTCKKSNTTNNPTNTNSYSDTEYEQEYTKPQMSTYYLKKAERAAMSYCSRVMSIYREVSSAVYTGDYNIIDEDTVYLDFNMTINGKSQIKSVSCQRRENGTWKASLYEYKVD